METATKQMTCKTCSKYKRICSTLNSSRQMACKDYERSLKNDRFRESAVDTGGH